MKFVDEVRIEVNAGDGGRGCVSFRREKFVPKGGPNGGDGGNGGSVWVRVDPGLSTLLDFRYRQHYRAGNGEPGMGKDMHGKNGADLEIRVPAGTLIYDDESGEVLHDLTETDSRVLLFKGGMGGRGNARFATATNRAPRHAQTGTPGEGGRLRLELRLLADVGLVGLPNAGKSTLISAVSAARPKIADYPFTTLVPNLGVVRFGGDRSFVMADIPGLIAGASEGHGLGTRFLRHVERTDLFVHLVDLSSMQEGEALANFDLINRELTAHDPELARKPQFVALSKLDLPEVQEQQADYCARFEARGYRVFPLSAVTGVGVKALVDALGEELERRRQPPSAPLDRVPDGQ